MFTARHCILSGCPNRGSAQGRPNQPCVMCVRSPGTPRSFQFFVVPARVSMAPAQASAAAPTQVVGAPAYRSRSGTHGRGHGHNQTAGECGVYEQGCELFGAVAVSWELGDEANKPTQCERAQAPAAARSCARRVRHMRDLRQAGRQEPAHAAPVERRSRRDHPRVTRRRPTSMGQRTAHAPALQPDQKQQERRIRARPARAHATASRNGAAIAHEPMVTSARHARNGGEGTPAVGWRPPRVQCRYIHRDLVKSQSDVLET